MTAITWACLVFLAGVALVTWANSHRPPPPHRTVDQVLDDVATYRANQRMKEAVESLRTCQAIWGLPTIPSQRKETEQ